MVALKVNIAIVIIVNASMVMDLLDMDTAIKSKSKRKLKSESKSKVEVEDFVQRLWQNVLSIYNICWSSCSFKIVCHSLKNVKNKHSHVLYIG